MKRIAVLVDRARHAFWILPAAALLVAIAAGLALPGLDGSVELPEALSFSGAPDTVRALLQMIATVSVSVAASAFRCS
jgi:uncharacterized membrane protein